jgi:uncharacterized protein (TIGR01777 family)
MKIAISGPNGFIGSALIGKLVKNGHLVNFLTRESFEMPAEEFLAAKIEGVDAVINLAGAPLVRRWTPAWKEEIRNSRILTTRMLAEAIRNAAARPGLFISWSAIGIYDDIHRHSEASQDFATDFLGQVCRAWEAEAMAVSGLTRVNIIRCGVVIGDGGMLDRLLPVFRIGAGGKIGSGDQPMSFIQIEDLVRIVLRMLEKPDMSGIYNATAPWPTTNYHFTETLGKVLNQPAFLTVPAFLLRWIYGEAAETLIHGQKVFPERLEQEGFTFNFPTIEKALLEVFR